MFFTSKEEMSALQPNWTRFQSENLAVSNNDGLWISLNFVNFSYNGIYWFLQGTDYKNISW